MTATTRLRCALARALRDVARRLDPPARLHIHVNGRRVAEVVTAQAMRRPGDQR